MFIGWLEMKRYHDQLETIIDLKKQICSKTVKEMFIPNYISAGLLTESKWMYTKNIYVRALFTHFLEQSLIYYIYKQFS